MFYLILFSSSEHQQRNSKLKLFCGFSLRTLTVWQYKYTSFGVYYPYRKWKSFTNLNTNFFNSLFLFQLMHICALSERRSPWGILTCRLLSSCWSSLWCFCSLISSSSWIWIVPPLTIPRAFSRTRVLRLLDDEDASSLDRRGLGMHIVTRCWGTEIMEIGQHLCCS